MKNYLSNLGAGLYHSAASAFLALLGVNYLQQVATTTVYHVLKTQKSVPPNLLLGYIDEMMEKCESIAPRTCKPSLPTSTQP
jgi:hypothetical protein